MKKLTKFFFVAAVVCMTCGLFAEDSAAVKALKVFQQTQVDFDFKKASFLCTSDVVLTDADGNVFNQKTIKTFYERKEMYLKMKKACADGKFTEAADLLEKLSGRTFTEEGKKELTANNGAKLKELFSNIESKYADIRTEIKSTLQSAKYEVIAENAQTSIIKTTYSPMEKGKGKEICFVVMSFEENMWLVKRAITKRENKK